MNANPLRELKFHIRRAHKYILCWFFFSIKIMMTLVDIQYVLTFSHIVR